ncbi:hypothetical protein QL093DRAFT_2569507 [Fusarium oxysporum]|nr:hypothetical protein QL093DRAFT_2569507 [Fusarium oxysporum]
MALQSCAEFLSYLIGILTVSGWQGFIASSALLTGNIILGQTSLKDYSFEPNHYFCFFMNTLVSSALPKFEGLILVLHVLGFFAILIPLGFSFMVGIMDNIFAFICTDAAFYISKETVKPSVVVLASILLSLVINSTCGFTIIIIMVFCIGLLEFLYIYNFKQVINSMAVFWSFACNCSLPFWCTLSKVNERITVPVWATPATTTISVLLSPINARSPIAFITAASLLISCLFYLLGASYIANNIFSIYYLTVISFFNF